MIATVVLVLRFALAISLYMFLGWSMLTMWRDLKQQGKLLSDQKKPGISITIKPESGRDRQILFSQPEIVIGRHANCDISFHDEALSAQHARITFHHGQWWLEDLNSTNGTFLNGRRLLTPAVVISEDAFKCGNIQFTLHVNAEDTAPVET